MKTALLKTGVTGRRPQPPAKGKRGGTGTKIPHGIPYPTFLETLCLRRSGPALGWHGKPLDMGYLFLMGSNILLLIIVQQLGVILVFSQKMSACPFTMQPFINFVS